MVNGLLTATQRFRSETLTNLKQTMGRVDLTLPDSTKRCHSTLVLGVYQAHGQ